MKNESEVITRLRSYEPLWDGWYYNEKLFGSGGSGCVLGLSRGEEKSVVKVIYIEDNPLKFNAVKDEIETMVTLRSEYLVECLNYRIEEVLNKRGERIGYDFLIRMNEYEPFSEFLREEDYDPNEICLQLARDIGGALCVLHSNGILHRDIKPENIFIDNSSGERRFRLGDFGVSKRIGDMSGLTTTGTLNFMAPESFKYYEYSYRSDIYNLGMTLYYILNDLKFPVFSEEESQSDFDYNTDCRLHGEKLPKPKYGSDALVKVVIKCCEANPKDRYKDISEALNDLFGQNLPITGAPIPQKSKGHTNTSVNQKTKPRVLAVFAAVLLFITIGVFVIFSIGKQVNSSQSNEEDAEAAEDDQGQMYVKELRDLSVCELQAMVEAMHFNTKIDSYLFASGEISYYNNNQVVIRNWYDIATGTESNECYYDFYYSYGTLYYIFLKEKDSSARIFVSDNEIINLIIGGQSPVNYGYKDERISSKYSNLILEANENYTHYCSHYDLN